MELGTWQEEFKDYVARLSNQALLEVVIELHDGYPTSVNSQVDFWKMTYADGVLYKRLHGWLNTPRPLTEAEKKVTDALEHGKEILRETSKKHALAGKGAILDKEIAEALIRYGDPVEKLFDVSHEDATRFTQKLDKDI